MKNKVLFVFLITAFINVFVYLCLGKGVSDSIHIADQTISKKLSPDSFYYSGHSGNGNVEDAVPIKPGSVINHNFIGLIFGYNFIKFNNIELSSNNYTSSLEPRKEDGHGYYVGISLFYPFGRWENFPSNLIFELFYNKNSFNFENSGNINIPQPNNTALYIPVKYSTDFNFSCINLNLDYNFNFSNSGFFCGVKIGAGIVINNKSSQFLEITSVDKNIKFIDEPNIKYKDNNRTMVINDGKVIDFREFLLNASPLLGFNKIINDRMFIRISGGYDFSLISLKKHSTWNYGNIFIEMGIFFWLFDRVT